MGRVQDAVCDALAAEIGSREKWDEPPAVLPVYLSGGRCHLGRLALPAEIWMTGPPAGVLGAIADAAYTEAFMLQLLAPGELHGAAFFTEMWMATAPAGTPEAEDLTRRAKAAEWRVSTMPDRVEARSIWAVDRAGITYTALQVRGSDEIRRAVSYPKAGEEGFTGAVPAALDKLVTAFLGVTLPARGRS
jgi:hypothetical protein